MKQLIKDIDGKDSSKRVMGILYLSIGALMGILDMFTNRSVTFEVFLVIVGTGGALLGLGLFEYFAKLKNNK